MPSRGFAREVAGMSFTVNAKPFVDAAPSVVNAVEIFSGEWACRFPAGFPPFRGGGTAAAFEDPRLFWAAEALARQGGSLAGAKVLELGPLEAAHTCMLSQAGAREILAVENNPRAFLKCLVVKEVLRLDRARFILGDAIKFLHANRDTFDVGVASAFLNHLVNPVEAIALLAGCCRALFFWNVVYDESLFLKQPALRPTFGPPRPLVQAGFAHTLYPHSYGEVGDYSTFWGGSHASCSWMLPGDILQALRHFGFTRLEHRLEDSSYGKALAVVAVRAG